jgi:hypothetical protein
MAKCFVFIRQTPEKGHLRLQKNLYRKHPTESDNSILKLNELKLYNNKDWKNSCLRNFWFLCYDCIKLFGAKFENKNFHEPEVLSKLIQRLPVSFSKECAQFAGWGAHYGAGIVFEVLYNELWKQKIIKPSVSSGALLGDASGIAVS